MKKCRWLNERSLIADHEGQNGQRLDVLFKWIERGAEKHFLTMESNATLKAAGSVAMLASLFFTQAPEIPDPR